MSIPFISRVRQIGPQGSLLFALLAMGANAAAQTAPPAARRSRRQEPPLPPPRRCR